MSPKAADFRTFSAENPEGTEGTQQFRERNFMTSLLYNASVFEATAGQS